MTNEQCVQLTVAGLDRLLKHITDFDRRLIKLEVENSALRSILFGVYRCYIPRDFETEKLFEDHIFRIHDHISGQAAAHPCLQSVADGLREFVTQNDAELRPKFDVIDGGRNGKPGDAAASEGYPVPAAGSAAMAAPRG